MSWIRLGCPAPARIRSGGVALACSIATCGCGGIQSSLAPAGADAERIFSLFSWMSVGGAIVWAAMVGLALGVTRWRGLQGRHGSAALIIGGGVVFPFVVLTSLMVFGLGQLPTLLAPGPSGDVAIEITGSQWWWRVRYDTHDGRPPIELANEIHLPVDRRLNIRLVSSDVVHSFWIPSLAGKMDMIPGRVNQLSLEPTRTGIFRGACAEYCGMSHARMNLVAVVVDSPAFSAWLDAQRQPASPPTEPAARRGEAAFMQRGCSTCHAVRGSGAVGVSGPDLTHVGSRRTIAAGTLTNGTQALSQWVVSSELLKPGVHMPAFAHLPEPTLRDLVAYLRQLQ